LLLSAPADRVVTDRFVNARVRELSVAQRRGSLGQPLFRWFRPVSG
jgi:hypothetical protein